MTGSLILTVSPGSVIAPLDEAGHRVALALSAEGIPVASRGVVEAEEAALEAALRSGTEGYGLVVILSASGDSTGEVVRRVLARVTGTRLVLNERFLAALEAAYARQDRPRPRRLDRLALVPQGATLWPVEDGEPGWVLGARESAVAVLPPRSGALADLVRFHLVPFAREHFGDKGVTLARALRTVGCDLAAVEERLGGWLGPEAPVAVDCLPVGGEVWVRLRARGPSLSVVEAALTEAEAEITAALGADCYGREWENLEAVVGRLLTQRHLTLGLAESCTGGLLGHRITTIPGSSAYLERGVVVYSNRAKEELLGVPSELLAAHGAVSAPVAEAMARGICRQSATQLGLAITGIAGPEGGTPVKPVGTVYIALATPDGLSSRRFHFTGDRESVKWQAAHRALDLLRRWLVGARGADRCA
ncbi:MAG: nicotinamide-nucleotide amidohydrolase family protein [Candidatus Methylomirabilia bacterium]